MNPVDIIERKRDGLPLRKSEIEAFVTGARTGAFQDYQISALLMAIFLNGMNARETLALTQAMAHSGRMLDLSGIEGVKVDKHSTGGVGDTTTLILAPLVAACGAKVAKMSGRGLGHTGGTLDKLESIPGLSVAMDEAAFIRQVNDIGLAIIGQTAALAPADKRFYALRDVTGTVGAIPLIVSSIVSKKLAAGADVVVLDVKTGAGALMKTLDQSVALAEEMVKIGCDAGRRFSALVTDMDQPLGLCIGNALEVQEAVDVLAGRVKGALRDVSLRLGAHMLREAGLCGSIEDGSLRLARAIDDGTGLERLAAMIERQGGDPRVTEDTRRLPQAQTVQTVLAPREGYVSSIQTESLGNAARALGAGRLRKEDVIDPSVGLVMRVRLGDYVRAGEPLFDLHIGRRGVTPEARRHLADTLRLSEEAPPLRPLILREIAGRRS